MVLRRPFLPSKAVNRSNKESETRGLLQTEGRTKSHHRIAFTAQKVQIQICASTLAYKFSIQTEAEADWTSLGSIDALEMTTYDFNGTIFGIFAATTRSRESLSPIKFGDFSMSWDFNARSEELNTIVIHVATFHLFDRGDLIIEIDRLKH